MSSASMSIPLIAQRYAKALFALADNKSLDQVSSDLSALRTMLTDSEDLRRVIGSPVISRADRVRAIDALAQGSGFHDLTKRFLGVVADNNRLFCVDAIAKAFLSEVALRRGETIVEVTAAYPLDQQKIAEIEASLSKELSAKTSVAVKVDPSIIGGLIIRLGSRLIDTSVKSKLDRLGRTLKTAA